MTDKKMPVVMVIDDDEVNHLILEKIMEKDGIKAVMADNGDTGLKIARKELPDLILLDIFMPGDDGFEILRQFMSDPVLKDIPVIIFTILEREKKPETSPGNGSKGLYYQTF